jgi:hypothetical protein
MLNKARKRFLQRERGGDEHWSELQENHETVLNNAFCWGDLGADERSFQVAATAQQNGVFQWISEPKLRYIFENALVRGDLVAARANALLVWRLAFNAA